MPPSKFLTFPTIENIVKRKTKEKHSPCETTVLMSLCCRLLYHLQESSSGRFKPLILVAYNLRQRKIFRRCLARVRITFSHPRPPVILNLLMLLRRKSFLKSIIDNCLHLRACIGASIHFIIVLFVAYPKKRESLSPSAADSPKCLRTVLVAPCLCFSMYSDDVLFSHIPRLHQIKSGL